jgi:hypothetical protein
MLAMVPLIVREGVDALRGRALCCKPTAPSPGAAWGRDSRAVLTRTTQEIGHGGTAMVRKVCGHLGRMRHRADSVEYRVEQFGHKLGDRLGALGERVWHRHWHQRSGPTP